MHAAAVVNQERIGGHDPKVSGGCFGSNPNSHTKQQQINNKTKGGNMARKIYVRDSEMRKGIKRFYYLLEVIKRPFEEPMVLICRKKNIRCPESKKSKLWFLKNQKRFSREFSVYEKGMFDKIRLQIISKKKHELKKLIEERKLQSTSKKIRDKHREILKRNKPSKKELKKQLLLKQLKKQRKINKLLKAKQLTLKK